jgi:predicted LPLAT superfamily acyltransferase
MSIPDIDYELGKHLGQFEYSVPIAAMRPEETQAVATAVKYGEQKAQQRILEELESLAQHGVLQIPLFKLRKIVNND